jgi:hypothetical protein
MINSNSLSDEQLKEYADSHIMYEIEMMLSSVAFLLGILRQQSKNFLSEKINNFILDAYAIHVRNIINFLYPPKNIQPTDITIHDYASKEDIEKHLLAQSDLLEKALIKTHKQVAHLTTNRISYEGTKEKSWKFVKITEDITKSFISIAPYIPQSKSKVMKELFLSNSISYKKIDVTGEATLMGVVVHFKFELNNYVE